MLAFGWLFIVFEFVFASYNLYLLISGHSNNAIGNCFNALCGFWIVYMFQKNKDKVYLSKGYLLLTLFGVMCCAVIFVLRGSILRPMTVEDFTAFLIMAVGVVLIVYLFHKFFNRGHISVQWKIHNELPPFSISHSIKGRQHTIKISPVDKADDDKDDEYLPF